jgi:hypothetical protein
MPISSGIMGWCKRTQATAATRVERSGEGLGLASLGRGTPKDTPAQSVVMLRLLHSTLEDVEHRENQLRVLSLLALSQKRASRRFLYYPLASIDLLNLYWIMSPGWSDSSQLQ